MATLISKETSYSLKAPKVQSRSNRALIVVWPWENQFTAHHDFNIQYATAVKNPVFLEDGALQVSTRSSKGSHVSQCQITLKDANNLATQISPSDWMGIWMFDNVEDYKRIKALIKDGKPANQFRDGLKFLGRVSTLTRALSIDPRFGRVQKQIGLQGMGFTEFDSLVYFDPALDLSAQNAPNLFIQRLMSGMQAVNNLDNTDVNTAIPSLVQIFIGYGPHPSVKGKNNLISKNTSFLVPASVAKVFGNTIKDDQAQYLTYSSMLYALYGVQSYPGNTIGKEWSPFIPTLTDSDDSKRHHFYTGKGMLGKFGAQVNAWAGVPVWSILQQYLNPSMNEMYTCLRVAPNGTIQPTLVVRQIPFNTELPKSTYLTRFLSLPRWKIPTELLISAQTAKSNAMRTNFVQVTNINPPGAAGKWELAQQRANSPPVVDYNDLLRNGMYGTIQSTNTFAPTATTDNAKAAPAQFWTYLTADRMMGGHLKWSGQFSMKGIQEPICEGDNVQIEDIVYHIEAVQHSMSVNQESGAITWDTNLSVSNGVPATGEVVPDIAPEAFDNIIRANTLLNEPPEPSSELPNGVV